MAEKGKCSLQLLCDQERSGLRVKEGRYQETDDDPCANEEKGLYTETSFTSIAQNVEKSVIDLFGVLPERDSVSSDLHFMGPLHNFNMPLIKNSWLKTQDDLLKLPEPQI